jgi:TPR repeat protein
MTKPEEIKLDEIKRLLRRLDKTPPPGSPASQAASDFAPPQFATRYSEEAQPSTMQPFAGPSISNPIAAYRGAAPAPTQAPTGASVRTILLAAGVSAVVSGSLAYLVFSDSTPRPAMITQVPATPAVDTGQPAPTSPASVAPISPAFLPSPPSESMRAEAAAPATDVQEAATEVTATPEPPETRPLETGSPERVEPPKETAPQQAAQERASTSNADGQTLAALDASQFLRRGLNMLDSGNVSAAQLLLERAAELGNGQAAFALATTYDGAPGAPRSASTVRPNVELAWRWYERAQELGIEDAGRRLAELKKGVSSGG